MTTPLEFKQAKSWQIVDKAYEYFNAQHNLLKNQLRDTHKRLVQKLFFLLEKQAYCYQLYGQPDENGYYLRGIRTNCNQLAKMMSCNPRTIRNLRKRLVLAGWIKEEFHGSNGALEIWLNTDLIHLQNAYTGHPENMAGMFSNPLQGRKILPHTLPSVTRQDTSKLNELSGTVSPQVPANPTDMGALGVENTPGVGGKPQGGESVDLFGQDTTGTNSGYKASSSNPAEKPNNTGTNQATPPKVAPKGSQPGIPAVLPTTLAEVIGHLSEQRQRDVLRLVRTVWNAAASQLYHAHYLDERQLELAQIALAEYLAYSDPQRWKAGATELITRIELVKRWIDRRHRAGKKAFVPIPEVYFDWRNQRGFAATKPWYKAHRRNITEIKNKELLTKARNEYLASLEPRATVSPTDCLRLICQRLGKRSPHLVQQFKESILNVVATKAA